MNCKRCKYNWVCKWKKLAKEEERSKGYKEGYYKIPTEEEPKCTFYEKNKELESLEW